MILGWILLAGNGAFAQQVLEILTLGDDTYTNVVVTSVNETDIYIKHDGGVANLKVNQLPREAYRQLVGSNPRPAPDPKTKAVEKPVPAQKPEPIKTETKKTAPKTGTPAVEPEKGTTFDGQAWGLPKIDLAQVEAFIRKHAITIGATFLGLSLYFSICLFYICKKVEVPGGFLVWIPIFQIIPMLWAAGLSGWLFILCLVPYFNVVVLIYATVQLCNARGKSGWCVLMGPFLFLYLAFAE